jgi:AraC-like DNA-binding protein
MRKTLYSEVFHRFIRSRINLFIFGFIMMLEGVVYFIYLKKEPLLIFPLKNKFFIKIYTDNNDGGNSEIVNSQITDSAIKVTFVLKKGFVRPYIGLSILPAHTQYLDISGYNQVKVIAKGQNLVNMNLHIVTDDKRIKEYHNKIYCSSSFEISNERNVFFLSKKKFKIPDWWYDINNYSPSDTLQPDWKKVLEINFATGLTPEVDKIRELSIYSVLFIRDNTRAIIYMLLNLAILALLLFVIEYMRYAVLKDNYKVTIRYKPVEVAIKSDNQNSYFDYINANFQNPELSLEEISANTGISHRKISEGVATHFQCNVKTYINKIRINEAQRLLKETELNVSEIAFKVGFSSPSNFNRVFKAITGENPTEFSHKKK